MMEAAARIAWAAILIKTRQLICLMVRVSGLLSLARSGANGPEWTDEGPQNGPQFLTEFWGSLREPVSLITHIAYISVNC